MISPQRIAILPAKGLGDGLLYMILSHNLQLAGYDVTTFSNPLVELSSWFPAQDIQPVPLLREIIESYPLVIASDHVPLLHPPGHCKMPDKIPEQNFNKKKTVVENLVEFLRREFSLTPTRSNGITLPSGVKKGKQSHVVVMHPTSSEEQKNWPLNKYLIVAEKLLEAGFEPALCLSAQEREHLWPLIKKGPQILCPHFPNLHSLASFVAEAGFMMGNDSGMGHLASCLGLPTLSLFARKSYSSLWRPGWGPGIVVTPLSVLPGLHLKQKYWKQLLTPKRVFQAFKKMRERAS